MSFGWSVGDLIQGISIGIKVVEALNSSRGAPSGYQEINRFLRNVKNTLEPLQDASAASVYSSSKDEIENLVKAIDAPLQDILGAIQKYDAKLGAQVDPKWYKHAPQKLLWEFWGSSKAKTSRTMIEGHLQTLTLLLQRLTYDKINTLSTPANTAQITQDALDLYDKDVLSQRYFEIMRLLNVMHQQQTNFKIEYPALNIDSKEPPSYSAEQLSRSTTSLDDLGKGLEVLKSYAQEDILASSLEEAEDFRVEDRFARDIQFWLQDFETPLLWIQGPLSTDFSSLACASILGAAQEADVPTLQYFCGQEVAQSLADLSETERLLRLTYSVIYQLVKFSITGPSSKGDFTLGDFDRLDGSAESLPEAFIILRSLLATRSKDFLIVIDGAHLIDDLSGKDLENHAHEFFGILQQCNELSINQLSGCKILLGTSGQTPLLENMTGVEEQLDATRSTKGALCLRTTLSAEDFKINENI